MSRMFQDLLEPTTDCSHSQDRVNNRFLPEQRQFSLATLGPM
jgi:hypothetical protein